MNNSHANASNANFNAVTQLTNLDYKHSIKLPPLKLPNFNGDPLHFNERINNFYSIIHHNTSITDTHRITSQQNSVSGKAKDLIHADSYDPSYYQSGLNELINHFGDLTIVVNAFINQLENWQVNHQNKQSFIAFSSFLKRLARAFQYLGFIADLQSTTLLKKAKEKVPQNFILKWTAHCLTEFRSDPSLAEFQQWLELQAKIYDKINRIQHKQTCPSTKRCQVCSGFHHTTLHDPAEQIKRPTAAFSTENAQKRHPTVSSSNKTAAENTINNFQIKGLQNKN